jgi:hypothetical protein
VAAPYLAIYTTKKWLDDGYMDDFEKVEKL